MHVREDVLHCINVSSELANTMNETEQTKLTMIAKGWRPRILIAFAIMTLIPLLAVVFLGVISSDQSAVDSESAVLVGVFSIILSLAGFSIVIRMLCALSMFRSHLSEIIGERPSLMSRCEGRDGVESITRSVNAIVGHVQHDRERLRILYEELQGTVEEQAVELKQMKEHLRDSRERFSKAIHASPVPILIVRLAAGRIIEANDAFFKLMGLSAGDVVGRLIFDMHIGADFGEDDRFAHLLQEQNRVAGMPFMLRIPSGAPQKALVTMESIKVSGKPCALVMLVGAD